MAKSSSQHKKNIIESRGHPWVNFQPGDKLAIKLYKEVEAFEDNTIKARQELAKKYNVVYHRCYFTRFIPTTNVKRK
jgi:hypothetical protein